MPQQPQLDPNYDYAQLPDGSYAQFKKGTSQEQMRTMLIQKGLLKSGGAPSTSQIPITMPPPFVPRPKGPKSHEQIIAEAQAARAGQLQGRRYQGPVVPTAPAYQMPQYYGFTPKNIARNTYGAGKALVKSTVDISKDLASNPNWFYTMPEGQRPSTFQKFILDPHNESMRKAQEAFALGHNSEGYAHLMAAGIPLFGPMAESLGEQIGTGDIGGGVTQAAAAYLMLKGFDKAVDKAGELTKPGTWYLKSGRLNNKVLKIAKEGANLTEMQKVSDAYTVAARRIRGNMEKIGPEIEKQRFDTHQKYLQQARDLTQAGHTIDISQDVAQIEAEAKFRRSYKGVLDQRSINEIDAFLKRLKTRKLPNGMDVQVDLSRLAPQDIVDLTSAEKGVNGLLSQEAELDKGPNARPDAVNQIARDIRNKALDKLDNLPGSQTGRLRADESALIKARDSAVKQHNDALNDTNKTARGIIYGSTSLMGTYFALKMLGLGMFTPLLGTILIYKALASTLSRTTRAALYSAIGDMLDTGFRAARQRSGPGGVTGGASQAISPIRPQMPPQPRLTGGGPGAAPGAAGGPRYADATVVSQNPPMGRDVPVEGPLGLPAKATRARAGSGDYAKPGREAPKKPAEKTQRSPMAEALNDLRRLGRGTRQAAGTISARHNVAKSNTKTTTPTAPSQEEETALRKAMMDRLDNLLQQTPKSGAHRAAIEREVGEVKKILSGEATGKEAAAINKRIADRERLASKRSAAQTESSSEDVAAATQAGSASMAQSPEEKMIADEAAKSGLRGAANRQARLDMGYAKLRELGGPEGVKMEHDLRELAKQMASVDPDYDEEEAIAVALQAIRKYVK